MLIYPKQALPDELPLDIPLFVRTQIQQVAQVYGKTTWEVWHAALPSDYLFSCLFLKETYWLALHGYSLWIEQEKEGHLLRPLDGEWAGDNVGHAWLLFTPPATAASGWQFDASHLFVWSLWFRDHRPVVLTPFLDGREKGMAYTARLAGEIQEKQFIGFLESSGAMTDYQITAVQQTNDGVLLNRRDALIPWRRDQIWLPDQLPVAVSQRMKKEEAVRCQRRTLPPTHDPLNPHRRLF
jgi:hypothetical protein